VSIATCVAIIIPGYYKEQVKFFIEVLYIEMPPLNHSPPFDIPMGPDVCPSRNTSMEGRRGADAMSYPLERENSLTLF